METEAERPCSGESASAAAAAAPGPSPAPRPGPRMPELARQGMPVLSRGPAPKGSFSRVVLPSGFQVYVMHAQQNE